MVDLPEPDRPVNHRIAGFWLLASAREALSTVERLAVDVGRTAEAEVRIMPAATVWLVKRSIRMNAPVVRFSS